MIVYTPIAYNTIDSLSSHTLKEWDFPFMVLNSNMGYSAGKGSICFMVKSLAHELIRENIRVNGIAPGFIAHADDENKINVPGGAGKYSPENIVKAVKFLIDSSMVTGEIINVAGGHDIMVYTGI
ncbi:MAG: SDR family oxidoreductase [Ferroplasma sp.]